MGTEPAVRQWSVWSLSQITAWLTRDVDAAPLVLAVDGRSGAGKSTFAAALADVLDAAVLHTDDFAWWHSAFDWRDLLIDHALTPLRRGESVDFRPPAWIERGRGGSIAVAARSVIVVEGVGAAQQAMRPVIDRIVWVQSDPDEAERRGIERDLAERPHPQEAKRFWDEWMAEEVPFQERQRTWVVADLVVCGTPAIVGMDPGNDWLCADGPLTTRYGDGATAGDR